MYCLADIIKFSIFFKVAVPEGCDYVPLEKKATKPAKVIVTSFSSSPIVIDTIG